MSVSSSLASNAIPVDREALYEVLTVKDVAEILDISLPCAYELFRRKDFPSLPIAKRNCKKVSRAAFENWLRQGKAVNVNDGRKIP